MAKKFIEPGGRVMDIAWMRDTNGLVYTGEALNLAMLLHLRKERTAKQEEELKEVLGVFETGKEKNSRRGKTNKNRNPVR
jgi:hypothetical protein